MMTQNVLKLNRQAEQYLTEGVLIEDYVLKNISNLLKFMKECNITLRWIILHTSELPIGADVNKRCRQMLQYVITESQYSSAAVFKLLLNTAQFEFNLKEVKLKLVFLSSKRKTSYFLFVTDYFTSA